MSQYEHSGLTLKQEELKMKVSSLHKEIIRLALVSLLFLVWAQTAYAHVEGGRATGFVTGFHHPWSGLDHVLAMVAVGIWGAQLGSPTMWILPITFPLMMTVGAMMGLLGIPVPGIEIGIALSAIVLGSSILGEVRPNLGAAIVMVAIFAMFHGHAHGTELPPGQNGLLYSMGFVMGTGCLHGVGIALGTLYGKRSGRWALRTAGGFIAFMGVTFLWEAVV